MAVKSTLMRPKRPRKRAGSLGQDDSLAQVLADFATAYRLLDSGELDAYRGQYVAILKRALAGGGRDASRLRQQVSHARHVHPERIAIIHVFAEAMVPE